MNDTIAGPCIICAATNYPLSAGGPTICPSCDCGDFGLEKVKQQAKEIERLRAENMLLWSGVHIKEAKEEIEQLQTKVAQTDRYIALLNAEIADNGALRDENERLRAENKRLRMLAMEGRTVHGGWPDVAPEDTP